jgi:hypothetical protein
MMGRERSENPGRSLARGKGGPSDVATHAPGRKNAPGDMEMDDVRTSAVNDRITVALVKKAGEDLQRLQDRTGLSKTDIVNRAISLYEFIDAQVQAGNDLFVRDQKTKETQLLRFL